MPQDITILVTGASGFMGRHLMSLLPAVFPGSNIIGLDLAPPRKKSGPLILPGDLLDKKETIRLIKKIQPGIVFHLAGIPAFSNQKKLKRGFIEATKNLLDALGAYENKKCRFILASSSTVYGHFGKKRSPVLETFPAEPLTDYAKTKLAQERLCFSHHNERLEIIVARIFNLTGPQCPPHLFLGSMAEQISKIEKGLALPEIKTGNLNNIRDFIDIRDTARALVSLSKSGRRGEIYNVCSGRGIKLDAIVRMLLGMSKARCKIRIIKEKARVRLKKRDVRVIVGSFKKIKKDALWASQIDFKSSLFDTLESYRNNN